MTEDEALREWADQAEVTERAVSNAIAERDARIAVLERALNRAAGVFDWLAENEPDCYGWHPPYPSTSPGIKSEADYARQALGGRDDRN